MIFLLTAFLVAFLLDFLFGDPHSALHPVALAGTSRTSATGPTGTS